MKVQEIKALIIRNEQIAQKLQEQGIYSASYLKGYQDALHTILAACEHAKEEESRHET